ncbi:DAK2 domain-containing protein [Halomonas eurihalina]|uniref:DAK2 domain-containing protein n=1 Tax=Halomonas eurihalina TaxID=42566 RepID=A0A5D9CQM2_HALER|nr:dihydroxyacetone kinase subunit DhaK [Halomonas eurihalina]MDR5860413.1 dihydroxyacetone kinase subunit DhaK [Halomonas eurihalina]TZG33914.1 DAK2 domain-containing protein [Halomonas eurihalina]
MERFYNAPERVVDDILHVAAATADLRIAEPESGLRILVRGDWDRQREGSRQVAVLSGGGAGHEPAHAGFIGDGMLTGVISGNLFASPSVEPILAAIREVCGDAGCLLVVKNYTGDRLNFGLAAERARGEGLNVEMVIVADDVAIAEAPQPRGIAGTLLVHKLAGYLASQGASLAEIQQRTRALCERMGSLGMALKPAAQPGQPASTRSPELGLGIHNEPGTRAVDPQSADDAMRLVLEPLLQAVAPVSAPGSSSDTAWVTMLNNLGSCSSQEMGVLTECLLRQLGEERVSHLIGPAPLMTSLDMHGFSVTLVPGTPELLAALTAPTNAPAWPGVHGVRQAPTFTPDTAQGHDALADDAPQNSETSAVLWRVIETLRESREELDALDAKTGDGDAGASMQSGADSIAKALDAQCLDTGSLSPLFTGIGQLLARDMGGSSGVLLSILFTAAGGALGRGDNPGDALAAGVRKMQQYGGARPGDRTMLDALVPAIESLQHGNTLAEAAQAARTGALATASLTTAKAGRSAYVPESALEGIVDPGAEAVARVFEALARP